MVTGIPENHIVRAIFEGLAVKNPYTLEPEPGVAESWDISEDGPHRHLSHQPRGEVVQRRSHECPRLRGPGSAC